MSEQIEPADAARALGEIGQRREQVIRRMVIPAWFWWAQAVLVVELAAAIETQRGLVLGIGIVLFTVGSFVINRPVSRAGRAAPLRRDLASPPGYARKGLAGLAAFVLLLLGVMVATVLGLTAAGVPYPTTIAAAVTAALFAVGGQALTRYEQAVLVRRARSRG